MTEKMTILPSLRNEDWIKVFLETEKVNDLSPNISTGNIVVLSYATTIHIYIWMQNTYWRNE